jgi:hypothetical protein
MKLRRVMTGFVGAAAVTPLAILTSVQSAQAAQTTRTLQAADCAALVSTSRPEMNGSYARPVGTLSIRSGPNEQCLRRGVVSPGDRLTYWCWTPTSIGRWVYLTNRTQNVNGWSFAGLLNNTNSVVRCGTTGLSRADAGGSTKALAASARPTDGWIWVPGYGWWYESPPSSGGNTGQNGPEIFQREGSGGPSDQSGPRAPSSYSWDGNG